MSCDGDGAMHWMEMEASCRVQAVSCGRSLGMPNAHCPVWVPSGSRLLHMSDTCITGIGQHG